MSRPWVQYCIDGRVWFTQRRRRNAHERSGKWTVDIYTLESGIQLPTEGAKGTQKVCVSQSLR
jgi:hypothetical protein